MNYFCLLSIVSIGEEHDTIFGNYVCPNIGKGNNTLPEPDKHGKSVLLSVDKEQDALLTPDKSLASLLSIFYKSTKNVLSQV